MTCGASVVTPSLQRWIARQPAWARVLVDAWHAGIRAFVAQRGCGDAAVASLRRAMVADVSERVAALRLDALSTPLERRLASELQAAWLAWCPQWIAARIHELDKADPELFLPESERRRLQSRRARAANAHQMQEARDVRVARDLLALMAGDAHGSLRWEPDAIARRLARRGPAPEVRRMADALVRLGAAEWWTTPSGRLWALELTHKGAVMARVVVPLRSKTAL